MKILENEKLLVEISEHGAEVTRFSGRIPKRKCCGTQIRRSGEDMRRSCFHL